MAHNWPETYMGMEVEAGNRFMDVSDSDHTPLPARYRRENTLYCSKAHDDPIRMTRGR